MGGVTASAWPLMAIRNKKGAMKRRKVIASSKRDRPGQSWRKLIGEKSTRTQKSQVSTKGGLRSAASCMPPSRSAVADGHAGSVGGCSSGGGSLGEHGPPAVRMLPALRSTRPELLLRHVHAGELAKLCAIAILRVVSTRAPCVVARVKPTVRLYWARPAGNEER